MVTKKGVTCSLRLDRILKNFKSRFQHRAQEIIDVRLDRIEFEHGDTTLDAELDIAHSRHCFEGAFELRQILGAEIFYRYDRGLGAHDRFFRVTEDCRDRNESRCVSPTNFLDAR